MAKTGYVYILCNRHKNVLYTGVTSDLKRRIWQHQNEPKGFVKQYNVHFLVYFESIHGMMNSIRREKQIKGKSRAKKEAMINEFNPNWNFLNEDIALLDGM